MAPLQRIRVQTKNLIRRVCCKAPKPTHSKKNGKKKNDDDDEEDTPNGDHDANQPAPQYRLEASSSGNKSGFWGQLLSCCCCGSTGGSNAPGIGMNHNQRLASTLHWMFRVNFILLFAVMCTVFFAWVMLFAGFIIAAGQLDNECVRVGT